MKTKKNKLTTCPVEDTVNIIGNKYTVLIIRDLMTGKKRFSELERSISGISPRTLSARLIQLENDKMIKKKIYPVVPPHTEYSLSEHGIGFIKVVDQIIDWNKKYRKSVPQGK